MAGNMADSEAVDPAPKWNLSDLYAGPEDPSLAGDMERSLAEARDFQNAYQDPPARLEPVEFLRRLQRYEAILEKGVKPLLYASLLFSEDTQDERYKALLQEMREKWSDLENRLLFFRLFLIGLPEEIVRGYLAYGPLQVYGHALSSLRRFRPFTRSEKEEEILNRKNMTGRSAFTTLFDEFTGAFTYRLETDGTEKEYTGTEMLAMLYSPDRNLRERAFGTFLRHHEKNKLVLTSIFNALVLDYKVEDEIRGYAGPMHQTQLENEIRQETVDLMMDATERHYPLAQEYFQIKACLLGLPRLKNSDIYAPLPGKTQRVTFDEARELLLKSFLSFHPLFAEIAGEFFQRGWVDAALRKGKYGGAFCSGMTPSLHPYVLMNFTGNLRDALTLAHEMGHAIHFFLSRKQTLLNFDPPLVLAETASVFGEIIMMQTLLQEVPDREARQALLCAEIEDIIATVFRQNVLTRFEKEMHDRRRDHLLTAEEIADLWWRANARLYGDAVEMIPDYRWGWAYISHFIHSRFYCYSYVFGELVVLALYEKYQEEGGAFLARFIRLLESGGAGSPESLLAEIGLDVNRTDFWDQGFQAIHRMLDELKAISPWDKVCTEQGMMER